MRIKIRLYLILLILILILPLTASVYSESPYIVKEGNIIEELSVSDTDVYVYGYVKLLNLGTGAVKVFEKGRVNKLRVGAGNVEIYGEVRDVQIGLGDVTLYGVVKGDIEVGLGNVVLKPNSTVEGNIRVVGEVKREEGSVVKGEIESTQLPEIPFISRIFKNKEFFRRIPLHIRMGERKPKVSKLVLFFVFLFVSFLILALFPHATERGVKYLSSKPMNSFLLSLVLLAISFGILILLVITIIGIILTPLVIIGVFIFYLFGTTIFYTTIGTHILKLLNIENPNLVLSYFVASIPLILINIFVPYGGLISFVSLVFGLGAAFKSAFPKLVIFNL